jgi:hypothetical protein
MYDTVGNAATPKTSGCAARGDEPPRDFLLSAAVMDGVSDVRRGAEAPPSRHRRHLGREECAQRRILAQTDGTAIGIG